MAPPNELTASTDIVRRLRGEYTFQISVDTNELAQGLAVARAAVAAGIDIIEMGTPLCKFEGVHNVVPAFRREFPNALLLADMKTMDGGGGEARAVFAGGGNIVDFLAIAGVATAKAACAARDEFRRNDPSMPRLAFADILLPHQGPAATAADVAAQMLDAGVDGVGVHLQLDARRADPSLLQGYLAEVAQAVFRKVGDAASVQVVGGLSIAQAVELARSGLRAFVVSGNLGLPDSVGRLDAPAGEIERLVGDFIRQVSAA